VLSRANAWTVAIVATLTMTVSYIDRSTLAVLGPSVKSALDIDATEYGWLTSAFSMAYLISTPLAGWWIGRVGARRGLVGSVLLWTVVSALHALVPGFGVLFALRIALGMAEGPSFPGAAQTIQRVLPPHERARGFGVLFTGSSLGGMIVPPLAAFLFDLGGWRFAFVGTALAGLLWVPAWILVTRRSVVRERLDAVESFHHAEKPSTLALLRDPSMIRALAAILASAPIFAFSNNFGAIYLNHTFHVQQRDVGHYLWLPPLVFDIGSVLFGDLASRQRRAPGAPPRLLFAIALSIALVLVLVPFARSEWEAVILLGTAMAGGGGIYTLAISDVLSRVPAGSVSLASGTVACGQSLAMIVAAPMIGASFDGSGSYDRALWTTAIWVIPGALVWLVVEPRRAIAKAEVVERK
jgi:MFS transporter, ACS family, hexuronate transporter